MAKRFVFFAAVIGLGCVALVTRPAWPASTWDVVLPQPLVRPTSGLKVKVDAASVTGGGYHVVRVFVGPLSGRATATRTVTVTLTTNMNGRFERRRIAVSKAIELPQGSAGVIDRIAVPNNLSWWSFGVQVEESGTILQDVSTRNVSLATRLRGGYGEARCNILVIDADAPTREQVANRRALASVFGGTSRKLPDVRLMVAPVAPQDSPNYSFYRNFSKNTSSSGQRPKVPKRGADLEILKSIRVQDGVVLRPFAELPEQWLHLSGYELVVISWDDLNALRTGWATRWRALRDWLSAGGTLVVFGNGIDEDDLGRLDSRLDLAGNSDYFNRSLAWHRPKTTSRGATLKGRTLLDQSQSFTTWQGGPSAPVEAAAPPATTQQTETGPRPDRLDFRWRPVELGVAVALAPRDPFPGRVDDWTWLFNGLGRNRWLWSDKHGIALNEDNPDTWKLLVPGVGMSPVGVFIVLISLFIILVGPVNYLLLRLWGRLYLLVITVPVAAGVVVAGTLAYAILADGLGVKLRVRSLTLLDQRSRHQVSWSWQTYYASLVPSGGLVFPANAAVYTVRGEMNSSDDWGLARHVVWDESSQQLASGYLVSRIPTVFQVIQPGMSDRRLEVVPATEAPGKFEVVNRLGVRIQMLLLYDEDGQMHWVENLADGARVQPHSAALADVRGKLQTFFTANRPTVPPGITPGRMGRSRSFFLGMFFSSRNASSISTSLLEQQLKAIENGLDQLPPCHYVAIVDAPPSVPVGDADATRVAPFHVIMGRW